MRLLIFKLGLIAGALLAARYFVTRSRSAWRDRVIVLVLVLGLVVAVIAPEMTTWAAAQLGVGRGVDLAFYVGFLLLFVIVGAQRVRIRDQHRALVTIIRELALLRARAPDASAAQDPRPGTN